jgi:ParB-like chromosome segregation protein Spo0J
MSDAPQVDIHGDIELIDPSKLNPVDWNPQERTDEERRLIRQSILQHGFVLPIIARPSDGAVAGGHGRLEVVLELIDEGYDIEGVPVIWKECSDAELRALNLALNNAQGRPNLDKVGEVLREIEEMGGDAIGDLLAATGFSDDEIEDILVFTDGGEEGWQRYLENVKGDPDALADPSAAGPETRPISLHTELVELVVEDTELSPVRAVTTILAEYLAEQGIDYEVPEKFGPLRQR